MAKVQLDFKSNTSGAHAGITGLQKSLNGLKSTASSVSSAIGKSLKVALLPLAAIGAGGIAAAFKGISLAADMESTEASFATLLGSLTDAKSLLAEISDTAKSTPYQFEELAQAGRSLLAITDKENVTSTLRMIGDLASASQKPITELASMYAKIKGGDIVQGEDINMIGDALGGGALQEFAKVLGVDGVKAVRKLGSEGKITGAVLEQVFKNLTSKGGMAFGAMTSQSMTFNGLISTLKDNFAALLRDFGTPVMLAIKPFIQEGIDLLGALKDKAKEAGEVIAGMIEGARNGGWKDLLYNSFMFAVTKMGEQLMIIVQMAGERFAKSLQTSLEGTELGKALTSLGLMETKTKTELQYNSDYLSNKPGQFALNRVAVPNPDYKEALITPYSQLNEELTGMFGSDKWADKLQGSIDKYSVNQVPMDWARDFAHLKEDETPFNMMDHVKAPVLAIEKTFKDLRTQFTPEMLLVDTKKDKAKKPEVSRFDPGSLVSEFGSKGLSRGDANRVGMITKNPLVTLQQTANQLLSTIVKNTAPKNSEPPTGAVFAR